MNLYLYLPAASAHPRSCLKGTIFGLVQQYYAQNTLRSDYIHYVVLLYRRLMNRGWEQDVIHGLILEACVRAKRETTSNTPSTNDTSLDEMICIHLQYHPEDITRRQLHQLYDDHLGQLFEQELGTQRLVIAYSRPRNIGEYVTQAKLHEAPERPSSTIMGEYCQGLTP